MSLIPVGPNTTFPACPVDGTGPVADLDRRVARQQLPVIVLLLLVCIIGTIGNLLVIIVNIRRRKKSSATVFILALAALDFFICAVTIPMRVFAYFRYTFSAPGWCEMVPYLTEVSLVSSLLLLVAIAEDRLRAVRRPTDFFMAGIKSVWPNYKHVFSHRNKRAVRVSVAVLICGLLMSAPYLLTAHEGTFVLRGLNCTITTCVGVSHTWSLVSFVLVAIPFFSTGFIIVVIYAMVYKHVYDSRAAAMAMGQVHGPLQLGGRLQPQNTESLGQETGGGSGAFSEPVTARSAQRVVLQQQNTENPRQETGGGSGAFSEPVTARPAQRVILQQQNTENPRQETGGGSGGYPGSVTPRPAQRVVLLHHFRLAKMLLLVTAVFLVTWLPQVVILSVHVMAASTSKTHHRPMTYVEMVVADFFQHLYYLNSALNPIIYTIAYKSFRQRLLTLFGRMTWKGNGCRVNEDDFVGVV
ncbi:5-hydroxytryptamine receptor-like [Branchiostoma floridae]|uniref:5-hydroxytryptamine receptor-like n=1 Tax=Branchiostoma floridae TaxID=7739 RepID=A0A9J7N059_BRAFL|nr:5-hydroxytryptamine receptor-like [Branchiostoma floridae]